MAEVRTRSPNDVDDVDGTFGKAEFLDYIGTVLHMSVSTSHKSFRVFWNEEDDESDSHQTLFSQVGPPLLRPPIVKDKITIALQHVDLLYNGAMLAQFWMPVMIGGRRFLKCSDQPFGLTYLRKGLCSYRKLCLKCYYCANNTCSSSDGGADYVDVDWNGRGVRESVLLTGPPSRVFRRGLPEYSPNVEFSMDSEYPLRDEAMGRKISDYMAVPVFDPNSGECIGVIELVSTAESIRVRPSTLKRKCRKFGIPRWPRKGNQGTCSATSTESNKDCEIPNAEYGQEVSHPNVSSQEGTTSSKHNSSQAATIAKDSFMMIKAAYGEIKKIKFQLRFSSRLVDMEMGAASRLKLKVGDFKFWYLDEDDDWILITCDVDMRTMESMGKNTIKVSITHSDDAPS